MGCAKSIQQANEPKQVACIKVGDKSAQPQKKAPKQNHMQLNSSQQNGYRDSNGHGSEDSDNESISSRKNKKTNANSYGVVQHQKSQSAALQNMQNNATNINIEEDHAANENDESLLQQKLQENQNKFIQNLKFQDSQQELSEQKQDLSNMFQNDLSKANNLDIEDNKENIYNSSNNNNNNNQDLNIPTLSTKAAYGKQDSTTNENYCNVLRQQSYNTNTNAAMMNSGITMIGSINMLNSGLKLQNSNIVTSGLDYEKKKRDLIRKISDEIDEIDEIDENNYQFGATKKTHLSLKNDILKSKKLQNGGADDEEDEDDDSHFVNKQKQSPIKQDGNKNIQSSQKKLQADDDDDDF